MGHREHERSGPPQGVGAAVALLLLGIGSACGSQSPPADPDAGPALRVDAGAEQTVAPGESVRLDGSESRLSPLEFWLADGDRADENRVVRFHSERGVRPTGELRDFADRVWGAPTDLIRIGDRVYGVDLYWAQLYQLFPASGRVRPLGPRSAYDRLHALAYDPDSDTLYAADSETHALLVVDRTTGEFRASEHALREGDPRGMAFDTARGRLVVLDPERGEIYSIDPERGRTRTLMQLPERGDGTWDELDYHGADLFAVYWERRDDVTFARVLHLDLAGRRVTEVGPELRDVSAHSLMVESLPERVRWSVEEGPGRVRLADAGALVTEARFSRPGTYTLRLALDVPEAPLTATTRIVVDERPRASRGEDAARRSTAGGAAADPAGS